MIRFSLRTCFSSESESLCKDLIWLRFDYFFKFYSNTAHIRQDWNAHMDQVTLFTAIFFGLAVAIKVEPAVTFFLLAKAQKTWTLMCVGICEPYHKPTRRGYVHNHFIPLIKTKTRVLWELRLIKALLSVACNS